MIRSLRSGCFGAAVAWSLVAPSASTAQVAPGSAGSGMPPASMMANPYLNPYMNPYLNPMATQRPMSGGSALMYMYAANSANGGLGSGRISGTRGGPSAVGRPKVGEMPNSVEHPGGGASKYFNPGPFPAGGGASRYYNRGNRYFNNNGR